MIAFYVKSVEYALKHLPVADEVLANAKFINVTSRMEATLSQVEYYVRRYNDLLPQEPPHLKNTTNCQRSSQIISC